jgi:sigma-B regulation protein RsbU (phosphoserine phosphatase)
MEITFLQSQLEKRKQRLEQAIALSPQNGKLSSLMHEVDSALRLMDDGTYGICNECHEAIECERLIANPLVRYCLDHLTKPERSALQRDLDLASDVQRNLLPQLNLRQSGWTTSYHYAPHGPVSGDYCDLIPTEGALFFVLGDVSGKGVAASMLMSHLHATFRSLAGQNLSLQKLVEHANRLFAESTNAGQFATMIVGSAEPNGKVMYVSAGHLPLFHISEAGVRARESTGVPLGMFCSTNFPVCELTLAPGDKLLLYTDGLTEIFNAAGDEFGVARVHSLAKRHGATEPQAILNACLDEIRAFSPATKQTDDLTLMVLHRSH